MKQINFFKYIRRSYHAALYDNIARIPARITFKHDCIALEILTDNQIGPKLNAFKSIRERIFGKAWHSLLTISNDKKLFISISSKHKTEHENFVGTISPDEIIFPKKLYAVSQDIWNNFIQQLANQEIVRSLDLHKHRHLWLGYNYATSAPTQKLAVMRANIIGSYHFLLSIPMTQAIYSDSAFEQHKLKLNKTLDFSALQEIKEDMNHGLFDPHKLTKIHFFLTSTVLKKLRHCPNFFDLTMFSMLIEQYSDISSELSNNKRQLQASNWIVSSSERPKEFAQSLSFARKLVQIPSAGILFFNSIPISKNKHQHIDASHYKDYFSSVFNDLVYRQLLSQASKLNIAIDSEKVKVVKNKFIKMLINNSSFNRIHELQERWQRNRHIIDEVKPIGQIEQRWEPIIENTTIDNIKIIVLTSAKELKKHGEEMQHCLAIGNFTNICRTAGVNIIKFIDSKGVQSTVHMEYSKSNGFSIRQHRAYGGVENANFAHIQVGIKLVDMMNANKITLSPIRLSDMKNVDFEQPHPLDFYYDFENLDIQEAIYKAYKGNKALPAGLLATNYQEMIKNTQLKIVIEESLLSTDFSVDDKKSNLGNK